MVLGQDGSIFCCGRDYGFAAKITFFQNVFVDFLVEKQ